MGRLPLLLVLAGCFTRTAPPGEADSAPATDTGAGAETDSAGDDDSAETGDPPDTGDSPDTAGDTAGDSAGDTGDSVAPPVDRDGDGHASDRDCDDDDPSVFPGAPEVCNRRDDDCDGRADARDDDVLDALPYYTDEDRDGYGLTGTAQPFCYPPSNRAALDGDCRDDDPTIHPGATETCDGRDQDCDAAVDDGVETRSWYRDLDGDGAGAGWDRVEACAAPEGFVDNPDDCDDGDPTRSLSCVSADERVCPALEGVDDGSIPVFDGACDEGIGFVAAGGACWFPVVADVPWADARATCEGAGGWLAAPRSAAEEAILLAMVPAPWLGVCDGDAEGVFLDLSGEPAAPDRWAPGQPDDLGVGEDCVVLGAAGWDDVPCGELGLAGGFVCTWPLPGEGTPPHDGDTGGAAPDTGDTGAGDTG